MILSLLPGAALAQVCSVQAPDWDGTPVTAVQEAITLGSSPAVLVLLLASALVIRFKHQWGALVVVLLWTALVSFLSMFAPDTRALAMAEGCVGSPALFIGIIAAICVGMIFYTAPVAKPR
jgi:hypothetical protein